MEWRNRRREHEKVAHSLRNLTEEVQGSNGAVLSNRIEHNQTRRGVRLIAWFSSSLSYSSLSCRSHFISHIFFIVFPFSRTHSLTQSHFRLAQKNRSRTLHVRKPLVRLFHSACSICIIHQNKIEAKERNHLKTELFLFESHVWNEMKLTACACYQFCANIFVLSFSFIHSFRSILGNSKARKKNYIKCGEWRNRLDAQRISPALCNNTFGQSQLKM